MLGVKYQTLVGLENFNWSDSGNTFCLSESEFSLGILNKGQPFSENTFGSQNNSQMIVLNCKNIKIKTPKKKVLSEITPQKVKTKKSWKHRVYDLSFIFNLSLLRDTE